MKKHSKVFVFLVFALLICGAACFATLAFLSDTTQTLQNTFTVGDVDITLDEADVDELGELISDNRVDGVKTGDTDADGKIIAANVYKLIPGQSYIKDPTIKVVKGSEPCYVFAKIENGLGDAAAIKMNVSDTEPYGWILYETVDDNTQIWYYPYELTDNDQFVNSGLQIFSDFTFSGDVTDISPYVDKQIKVTAYAIQSDHFKDASGNLLKNEAWAALDKYGE